MKEQKHDFFKKEIFFRLRLSMETNITMTKHAENRASKSGINFEQIKLCVQYGEEIYRTGGLFFFMSDKCLKKLKKIYGAYLSKLEGLVVLTQNSNTSLVVVTVYKDRQAMKVIRKKQEYNNRRNHNAEYYN
jgi:hypothetical protein